MYHWKVGAGTPLAPTVKLTDAPTATVCEAGWVVIWGTVAVTMFSRASPLVTLPLALVTRTE